MLVACLVLHYLFQLEKAPIFIIFCNQKNLFLFIHERVGQICRLCYGICLLRRRRVLFCVFIYSLRGGDKTDLARLKSVFIYVFMQRLDKVRETLKFVYPPNCLFTPFLTLVEMTAPAIVCPALSHVMSKDEALSHA